MSPASEVRTTDPFDSESNEFLEDNKITIRTIKYINKYLKDLGEVYVIPYINCHSIFLKSNDPLKNNNLLLLPKGCGKTTFLKALALSNPKRIRVLPEKMYESFLSQNKEDYFNGKILVHYDFIDAVGGLDKKQREQLLSFWSSLLSDGRYVRENNKVGLENINCCTLFGMAKENFDKHRREYFEATFLDRLIMIHKSITKEEKTEILNFRRTHNLNYENFNLKLIGIGQKKSIEIKLDTRSMIGEKVDLLSLELDEMDVVTFTRAQDYIFKFLKCNAHINNRNEVNESDLIMYRKLHKYHLDQRDISILNRIQHIMKENPRITNKEIEEKYKLSHYAVVKYGKMAREKLFTTDG